MCTRTELVVVSWCLNVNAYPVNSRGLRGRGERATITRERRRPRREQSINSLAGAVGITLVIAANDTTRHSALPRDRDHTLLENVQILAAPTALPHFRFDLLSIARARVYYYFPAFFSCETFSIADRQFHEKTREFGPMKQRFHVFCFVKSIFPCVNKKKRLN